MKKTFTFTMELTSDPMNHAHDVTLAMDKAIEEIRELQGTFEKTNGGTVEDIQGRVLASWEVTEHFGTYLSK